MAEARRRFRRAKRRASAGVMRKPSSLESDAELCVAKAVTLPAESLEMGTSGVVASLSLLVGGGVLAMAGGWVGLKVAMRQFPVPGGQAIGASWSAAAAGKRDARRASVAVDVLCCALYTE